MGPEDDIMEAEIAEVEAGQVITKAEPVMAPPMAPKPKKRSKKPLLIASIIILIIVVGLIIAIWLPRPISDITLIVDESEDGTQLRLNGIASSESATEVSGTATITITYEGTEVYKNSNWKFDRNSENIEIPFNEFVMGNGDYLVKVELQGKTDEVTYEVDFVIEDATISAFNPIIDIVTYQPEFTYRVALDTDTSSNDDQLPKSADIKINEIEHENGVDEVPSGIGSWEDITGDLLYQVELDYEESGNYTTSITVRNNHVKSTSEYYEIDVDGEFMINAAPIAKIETDDDDGEVSPGTTVHFDGRPTIDDGDNIVEYEWYFEDSRTYQYGAEVDHTFWNPNTTSGAEGWWSVKLKVTDNGHGEEGKTNEVVTLIRVVV